MPDITKISHGLTIGDLKFGNARPGVVEATLKPGETMEQALDELDERLNAWHRKRYPHQYQEKETYPKPYDGRDRFHEITSGQLQPTVIDYGKHDASPEGIIGDIKRSETLEELKTYKLLAGTDKSTYDAYCQRIKELSNA